MSFKENNIMSTFKHLEKNEQMHEIMVNSEKEFSQIEIYNRQKIYYISDLHLLHRLKNNEFNYDLNKSEFAKNTIEEIVENLLVEFQEDEYFSKYNPIMLIGGDTSTSFELFEFFVKVLREKIDNNNLKLEVIFLLGNHELWEHHTRDMNSIAAKYKKLLEKYEMILLQNEIIYKKEVAKDYKLVEREKNKIYEVIEKDTNKLHRVSKGDCSDTSDEEITRFICKVESNRIHRISEKDILMMPEEELKEILANLRLIMLGGVGFSGYNQEFNANNGIYRNTLKREQEIQETKKFEKIYEKILKVVGNQKLIVFTHMPKRDWCSNPNPDENKIYISGHTHKNISFDDGLSRIYENNQIGYGRKKASLKYIYMETEYDCFSSYEDGIYEISRNEYKNFYLGKNINMDFNRKINELYMIKKKGYYCFIHKTLKGSLQILNGGALKKLPRNDIEYYYQNMDRVINIINEPLVKYIAIQKKIANEIIRIGGSGHIHGCIVDIDYFNHIYVNPIDQGIYGYYATDMANKVVYPNILSLLEEQCPKLYENLLLKGNEKLIIQERYIENSQITKPQLESNTAMYGASREIKKMQKINSNILTTWVESESIKIHLID